MGDGVQTIPLSEQEHADGMAQTESVLQELF